MEVTAKEKIIRGVGEEFLMDGKRLSLSVAGQQLSDAACSLLLLLAYCEVKWVPAFLFLRPYLHQRRWQFNGEVSSEASKSRKYLPQWPLQLFEREYFRWNYNSVFPYSELDVIKSVVLSEGTLTGEHPRIIEELHLIASSGAVQIITQNCTVGFAISEDFKDDLRRKCSENETIRILSDLVLLTIEATPDPYAESLWNIIYSSLHQLIEETVIPFLSVARWADLKSIIVYKHHQAELLRFLAFTAICGGFSLSSSLPFDCEIQSDDGKLTEIGVLSAEDHSETLYPLLIFRTRLCRLLADQFEPSLYLTPESVVVHDQYNFSLQYFGIVIYSLYISTAAATSYSQYEIKLNKVRDWYLMKIKSNNSSAGQLSRSLLSGVGYGVSKGLVETTVMGMNVDNQVQAAIGLAKADCKDFPYARILLLQSIRALESENRFDTFEYGLLTAEFVKCCNELGKYLEGESAGRQVIERRRAGSQIDHREDTIYTAIAWADSLVAMGEYIQAHELLSTIGMASTLTDYLEAIIALRLNKVKRRIDHYETLGLGTEGTLWRAISRMHSLGEDVKLECADELLSTISLLKQHQNLDCGEAAEAIAIVTSQLDVEVSNAATWRSSVLRCELVDVQQTRTLLIGLSALNCR